MGVAIIIILWRWNHFFGVITLHHFDPIHSCLLYSAIITCCYEFNIRILIMYPTVCHLHNIGKMIHSTTLRKRILEHTLGHTIDFWLDERHSMSGGDMLADSSPLIIWVNMNCFSSRHPHPIPTLFFKDNKSGEWSHNGARMAALFCFVFGLVLFCLLIQFCWCKRLWARLVLLVNTVRGTTFLFWQISIFIYTKIVFGLASFTLADYSSC